MQGVDEADRTSPEEKLWQAVCLMFLIDVQQDFDNWRESYNGTRSKYQGKINEHLNTLDSDHMELVCELAGVNYDAYAKKIHALIEGRERIDVKSLHQY